MIGVAVRYVAQVVPYDQPMLGPEGEGWSIVAQDFRPLEIRIVWRRFEPAPLPVVRDTIPAHDFDEGA